MQFEMTNSEINSKFTHREPSGKSKKELQQELGAFSELLSSIAKRRNMNLASFIHWIKPAILHDQYKFIESKGEIEPIGYIIWGWVNHETLEKYMFEDRFVIQPMNWNEGNNLIIVDYCLKDGVDIRSFTKQMYRDAYRTLGITSRKVNVCIRDGSGTVLKNNWSRVYAR